MSTWTEWSYECSKACAGGVNTRERSVLIEAVNGGKCNQPTTDERSCNTQACRSPPVTPGNIFRVMNNQNRLRKSD